MDGNRASSREGIVPVRAFAVQAALALFLFTTLAFVGIFWRFAWLAQESVTEQARSYIDLIVDTRSWNASHGGVWVLKTTSSPTNRYLRVVGIDPDTSTVSGTELTLRNPSAMTAEISQIARAKNMVTFRLTSLKPINPANAPDTWERQQLAGFETNRTEVPRIERSGGSRVLRLMRPLDVDTSCLRCHGTQGYRVGDIRGAISVAVPLAASDRAVAQNGWTLLGIYILVLTVGGIAGFWLVSDMIKRIDEVEEQLRTAASTDALTGLAARSTVLERLDDEFARATRIGFGLGVIMMDLDHFKSVNDSQGHAAGDTVLRELATRLAGALREYDMLGRVGGEEFLVVAAETDSDGLAALAERLRSAVAVGPVEHGSIAIRVTVSVGATLARRGDTPDTLVARADDALYRAKALGRNRVEID